MRISGRKLKDLVLSPKGYDEEEPINCDYTLVEKIFWPRSFKKKTKSWKNGKFKLEKFAGGEVYRRESDD